MKRIVMYINQFFGGIGGEDKAAMSLPLRRDRWVREM